MIKIILRNVQNRNKMAVSLKHTLTAMYQTFVVYVTWVAAQKNAAMPEVSGSLKASVSSAGILVFPLYFCTTSASSTHPPN